MALKKPIVLGSDGNMQQLQTGDSIANVDLIQLTNDNAGSVVICSPVYSSANDHYNVARANAASTSNVIGLQADTTVATGAVGGIQTEGILAATTGQWDAVAGTTGGLTKDIQYFLDPATAGKITATPPSVAGQYNVSIGLAISTTEMEIRIREKILL